MPNIGTNEPNPLCLVGLTPKSLLGQQCAGATSHLWSFIQTPVGSAASFANAAAQNTTWLPDIAGTYRIKYCCYFDSAGQVDPGYQNPSTPGLGCPQGAIAGDEVFIPLTGCENGVVVWSATGDFVSIAGDSSGVYVLTDPSGAGIINVTYTCTTTDQNNQQATTTDTCTFVTWNPDLELVCTVSPAIEVTVNLCGQYCECAEREFIVKLADVDSKCESDVLCLSVKSCPPPIEETC